MDFESSIVLEQFDWDVDETDKDANFKSDVALYTMSDPCLLYTSPSPRD